MSNGAFQGAAVSVSGSSLGTSLQQLLLADDIQPGSSPSYETCKTIYSYHPLGKKMADFPVAKAQSQERDIAVTRGPEAVVEAFKAEWGRIGADALIFALGSQARVYGIASLGVKVAELPTDEPLPDGDLSKLSLAFSVFDPLNTAGSLVLNQDTSAMDFQKHRGIVVNGERYDRSRCVVLMNERPLYIEWSNSAFGFSGRSVYQRALYPLKSYVRSMITNDMVVTKAGLIITKMKQAGSIINNAMQNMFGQKRQLVQLSATNNVLSIDIDEAVETLNMQNLDGAYGLARTNILKDIATAADMPAKILDNETLVEGFGEGTEDAKQIAAFVEGIRVWLAPAYDLLDDITQRRAWNEEFFASMQESFPETYKGMNYAQAFQEWKNSFAATWPSLLIEPESQQVQTDDVKLKALISTVEVLLPVLDPENRARVFEWFQGNINENRRMFVDALDLDFEALAAYTPPQAEGGGEEGGEVEPKLPKPMEL